MYLFTSQISLRYLNDNFFFFLVKLQYRPDLKAIFFGHVGVIDAHRDF